MAYNQLPLFKIDLIAPHCFWWMPCRKAWCPTDSATRLRWSLLVIKRHAALAPLFQSLVFIPTLKRVRFLQQSWQRMEITSVKLLIQKGVVSLKMPETSDWLPFLLWSSKLVDFLFRGGEEDTVRRFDYHTWVFVFMWATVFHCLTFKFQEFQMLWKLESEAKCGHLTSTLTRQTFFNQPHMETTF